MKYKSASAVLDYVEDWSGWLAPGDSIQSSEWIAPSDLTLDASSAADSATVFISGGTEGLTYRIVNRIVTAQGRTAERGWYLKIQSQDA